MTNKEKNYLLDMLWNNFNRSELDYYHYLYKITPNADVRTILDTIISLVDLQSKKKCFRDVIDILRCSQFNEKIIYKNKSQIILDSRNITQEQDDIIYSYINFILNNK